MKYRIIIGPPPRVLLLKKVRKGTTLSLCTDRGGVFLEFTVVLWFWVILLLSAFDIGNLLSQYYSLSQIAFETARSVSMVDGLRQSERSSKSPTEEERVVCSKMLGDPKRIVSHTCSLVVGQLRARTLVHLLLPGIDAERIPIEIEYQHERRQIVVVIASRLNALFPPYRLIPVRASVQVPYVALSEKLAS